MKTNLLYTLVLLLVSTFAFTQIEINPSADDTSMSLKDQMCCEVVITEGALQNAFHGHSLGKSIL